MSENIIFYGPPGTGKTYFIQSLMNKYIDFNIPDSAIKSAYVSFSTPWVLITLILLQNQRKMTTKEVQSKIDSLGLGVHINAGAELELHNIEPSAIPTIKRELPRIFVNYESTSWYVDFVRVQQFMPDFYTKFLNDTKTEKRYKFVTFHQSYSYEDFIEGIRPEYIEATKAIDYSPKPGIFKQLCDEARPQKEKNFAIFIDEINRGNISEIFGELISLIETDKRENESGALSAVLPYSKKSFSVPSNVNVYGTMNTADRSIDQIDVALRRRFKFQPILPSSDVIKTEFELKNLDATNIDGVNLLDLFETINTRIELLLDSQHLLGHALFLKATSLDRLQDVIKNSVIPLLEEYFYDDLQKIQLIFNDLDSNGDLVPNAIYCHDDLSAEQYFQFTGDYMINDKKHYHVTSSFTKDSFLHIYK